MESHLPVLNPTFREQFALYAAQLWRGEAASLQRISDSENYVYSFLVSKKRCFLRLTASHHRPLSQIEAELDFVRYLHQGGVSVSLPLTSLNGLAVEKLPGANHDLFACVFEEAEGEPFVFNRNEANLKHFQMCGQTLGRIHALARRYAPAANSRRFAWDEDDCIDKAESYLPQSESMVRAEYHDLMGWLRKLPKDEQSFGLIHGDFGATNYRYQDNRLNVFDFDDCCYHWFAYDLAITIYPHGWRREAKALLDSLLEGYCEENIWDARTVSQLLNFCRLRLLYMFLRYAKKWGFSDLSDQQVDWFAKKRENIEAGYKLS